MPPPASIPTPTPRRVPLPTSFGGVASVAERPGIWLAAWQWLFALLTTLVAIWTFQVAWGRGIHQAIGNLPEQGRIHDGVLEWPDDKSWILHQGPFLSIVVDPQGLRDSGLATDITLSVESDRWALRSLLGWVQFAYPPNLRLPLTRIEMASIESTWRFPVLFSLGSAFSLSLLLVWWLLSVVYGSVVWAGAAILGRPAPFRVARRLCGAALLPGCLLMIGSILLYATRQVGLVGLLLSLPLHIVVGWVYCAGGWTRLSTSANRSQNPDPFAENPFTPTTPPPPPAPPSSPAPPVPPRSSRNPFQPSE